VANCSPDGSISAAVPAKVLQRKGYMPLGMHCFYFSVPWKVCDISALVPPSARKAFSPMRISPKSGQEIESRSALRMNHRSGRSFRAIYYSTYPVSSSATFKPDSAFCCTVWTSRQTLSRYGHYMESERSPCSQGLFVAPDS
jgi:hypothetical protein